MQLYACFTADVVYSARGPRKSTICASTAEKVGIEKLRHVNRLSKVEDLSEESLSESHSLSLSPEDGP